MLFCKQQAFHMGLAGNESKLAGRIIFELGEGNSWSPFIKVTLENC